MIRSVGRTGPFKVLGLVSWQLKYNLLAVAAVAAILLQTPDVVDPADYAAILATAGIAASIFVGFRNTNAYQRWWEARTLWGAIINDSPGDAQRVVRHRHRVGRDCPDPRPDAPPPGPSCLAIDRPATRGRATARVVDLTEDPPEATATDLLNLQARDVRRLRADGHIDYQARVMLMSVNTNLLASQGGLERIRNQPMPIHYDMFIRTMAWVFALVAFNLLHVAAHFVGSIALGLLFMVLFVSAERFGYFLEQPMSNTVFDLPMYRFCGTITGDLLGREHPLARPREADDALVWW